MRLCYLQTDDLVPWLGVVFGRVVPFFPELLPGSGFALSHGVDGFKMRWVGQHGDMKGVFGSKIQLHRRGEVGEDVTDGRRGVGELAEAAHLTEHKLERKMREAQRYLVPSRFCLLCGKGEQKLFSDVKQNK